MIHNKIPLAFVDTTSDNKRNYTKQGCTSSLEAHHRMISDGQSRATKLHQMERPLQAIQLKWHGTL
jgi:hypothetical protein